MANVKIPFSILRVPFSILRVRERILIVSRATMAQRGQPPSMVRQTPPPVGIRIESGDIIEELEGSADVAPEVEDLSDGIFRWS